MKRTIFLTTALLLTIQVYSQSFIRSELTTELTIPWEVTMGPDDFLWLTDSGGTVSRVDPTNGEKTVVYTAPDYFSGSPLEDNVLCPNSFIRFGTFGLALHPSFTEAENAFIYFYYSYNSGTDEAPATKFRIKRLRWDNDLNQVVNDTNIVNLMPTGYDHPGGRLLAAIQDGDPYLFLTVGDLGKSEQNSPDCYEPQSTNPNNFTQDINTLNGKIHRFNMDGSIPVDNPIAGNSYYTRGHRHPQGLMYNPDLEIIYAVEHGDRTDDEVNILHKGMNYGWKEARGYHDDDNFEGEAEFVANYQPNPLVENDSLVQALYSWCFDEGDIPFGPAWCTIAPSGGAYYGSDAIPEWTNSLLIVTLKDGLTTDREVFQLKLNDEGQLAPSTEENPNPVQFFTEDQELNGRLRDIAISNDGMSIYLINNGGTDRDKIIVYTANTTSTSDRKQPSNRVRAVPNPVNDKLKLYGIENHSIPKSVQVYNLVGVSFDIALNPDGSLDISFLPDGIYILHLVFEDHEEMLRIVKIDN